METNETRTRYAIEFEARYLQRVSEVHRKFYGLINGVFFMLILLFSSTAFASIFSGNAALKLSGLAICITTLFSFAINPIKKQTLFDQQYKEASKIITESIGQSDEDFDRALHKARENALPAIDALRLIAQNDVMIEKGHPPYEVTWRETMLKFFT
ncbi:MAG: hypothetical protein FWC38_00805 [Proteobacteria bacterium]|nr:hypothetical protein [Pseudomonadota bacterium]MCL2306782.1 hypothetical protein [Pseudomonadota bacterium]